MPHFKRVQAALGTLIEISIEEATSDEGAQWSAEVFAEVRRLEKIFSIFDEESELAAVNRAPAGERIRVSPELQSVLATARKFEELSAGAFRLMPRCPHAPGACHVLDEDFVVRGGSCTFDLGGIAKGFVVDRAFELLSRLAGPRVFSVNAGGDLRSTGDGQELELRVPGASRDRRYVQRLLEPVAVATSSLDGANLDVGESAARYEPAPDRVVRTATVFASSCMVADAAAKIALLGTTAPSDLEPFGVHALFCFDEYGEAV